MIHTHRNTHVGAEKLVIRVSQSDKKYEEFFAENEFSYIFSVEYDRYKKKKEAV